MILSNRFSEAPIYAAELHATQIRKGSGVRYIAHLLGTASIALEYGASEDEPIASQLCFTMRSQMEAAPPPAKPSAAGLAIL